MSRVSSGGMTVMDYESPLLECCINCNALFEDGFDPIRHVSISFHTNSDFEDEEDEDEGESGTSRNDISILDALSSVFISNGLIELKKSKKLEECQPLSMCFKCAQTLSHLYQAYIELLTFSDPAARISKLIRQIEFWHQKNNLMVIPDEVTIKQEYDPDQIHNSQTYSEENLANYVDTVLGLGREEDDQESQEDLYSNEQFQSDVFIKEEGDEGSPTIVNPRRSTRRAPCTTETPSESPPRGRGRPPGQCSGRKGKGKKSVARIRKEGFIRRAAEKMKKPLLPQTPNSETPKKEDTDDEPEPDEFKFPPKKVRLERSKPRGFRFCPEPNCTKKYHFKWKIQFHILADHQHKKPSKCKKCSFKYFEIERLKNHVCMTMKERRASGLLYRCEYCGQAWAKRTRCTQHESTHDSYSKQVKCPTPGCRKRFKKPDLFDIHVREAHKDGEAVPQKKKDPAQCQICGKVLSNSIQLLRHMVIHNSDKNFLCIECGKGFQQRTGLSNHMFIHKDERKYQCVLCSLGFKRSCHLKAHYKSRTHENEPEKIAELLKQSVRQNATGPVKIPQKNKFKNHDTWAGRGKGRRQTNRRVQQNVQEEDQESSANSNEVQPSASQSTPPVSEFVEDGTPQLAQPIAPFSSSQAGCITNTLTRTTAAQFYGYPFNNY